jgi:predicted metal-dependent hydrolase
MNHSPRFWALVEKHYPDYKKARLWLRENGEELFRQ